MSSLSSMKNSGTLQTSNAAWRQLIRASKTRWQRKTSLSGLIP